jgi:hypothetical protein
LKSIEIEFVFRKYEDTLNSLEEKKKNVEEIINEHKSCDVEWKSEVVYDWIIFYSPKFSPSSCYFS